MMCSMCEAHVNDVIRKEFEGKKVKSNRKKNLSSFEVDKKLDEEFIRAKISQTGYELKEIEMEEK